MTRFTAFVVALLLSSTALAGDGSGRCMSDLKERIKRDHPHAKHIELWSEREWKESKQQNGFEGEGEYVGEDGKKRRFGWECFFNVHEARVARMSYDKPSKHK
jgi:hypothetical protein